VSGFLYVAGSYSNITDPLGTSTYAAGINSSGDIVGWYTDASGGNHGFFYNGSTFLTLDDPNAAPGKTEAIGINDAGEVVGYYFDAKNVAHGFLWNGSAYLTLDDPLAAPSAGTYAFGINDSGEIVGYYLNSTGDFGFLATPAVPEPSTWAMMLVGFAGLGLAGFRRATTCRSRKRGNPDLAVGAPSPAGFPRSRE
jgi:probable HAF family extracellular repeat protein